MASRPPPRHNHVPWPFACLRKQPSETQRDSGRKERLRTRGEAGSLPAHFALESRPSTRTKESFGRSRLRPTPPATQRQGAWFRLRLRLRRAPLARLHCARALARGRTAARRGRGGLGLRPAGPRGCGIPTRLELGREGRRGGS